MLSEFELIARYFTREPRNARTALGVGDDCALYAPTPGMQLAIASDMLVEGRHFFPGTDPLQLGHKCLAVNLSDLAAMGATPRAFTLALALPTADPDWLAPFADGLFALADVHGCDLIGGDTTRGPLNICITVLGEVPPQQALQRSGAQEGDDIWVSGTLGCARLAFAGLQREMTLDASTLAQALPRLLSPTPRVALGAALRGIAHAAIDISDGLIGDLGHILKQSEVGASVDADALPLSPALSKQSLDVRRRFALAGGDDYELCFTAAADRRDAVLAAGIASGTPVKRIGAIEIQPGLRLQDGAGAPLALQLTSFDHFHQP